MLDDRKKTMVLGALFVVIIGVGAFQMIPKGQPAPPPKKTDTAFHPFTPVASSAQKTSATTAATPAPFSAPGSPGMTTAVETPAPTLGSSVKTPNSTPTATPGASSTPAHGTETAPDASQTEPPLAERDPFEAPPDADASADNKGTRPAVTPAGRSTVASNGPSAPIKEISGNLSPVILPSGQVAPGIGGGKGLSTEPIFVWHLVGLMSGAHPLAVLADATGNQRLIRAGSSIDPDSKLISVDRDSATVVFRGKTLRLSLVGDQNAK